MIRPGPQSIPPGEAPGGVVFAVWSAGPGDPRLVLVRRITPGDDVELLGAVDGERVFADRRTAEHAGTGGWVTQEPLVVVVYDGDSGERMLTEHAGQPLDALLDTLGPT